MNVLAVLDRLVASVDDDDIGLDCRADLARDGAAASDAVRELIEAAKEADAILLTYIEESATDVADRLRAALARCGGAK